MSYSLWPHGLQHSRNPCPSLSPRACSNACSLSWWCHPIISTSDALFSSCLQSLPTSGSFPISRLFASGGQTVGASAPASVLQMNIQGWFPLGLIDLISLQSKGLWRVLLHHSSKASLLQCSAFFMVQLSHPYMTTGKTIRIWLLEECWAILKGSAIQETSEKETQRIGTMERKQPHYWLCEPREFTELFSSLVLPHLRGTWPHFLVSWGI